MKINESMCWRIFFGTVICLYCLNAMFSGPERELSIKEIIAQKESDNKVFLQKRITAWKKQVVQSVHETPLGSRKAVVLLDSMSPIEYQAAELACKELGMSQLKFFTGQFVSPSHNVHAYKWRDEVFYKKNGSCYEYDYAVSFVW